jgi:Protein of unknown function (DUF1573)
VCAELQNRLSIAFGMIFNVLSHVKPNKMNMNLSPKLTTWAAIALLSAGLSACQQAATPPLAAPQEAAALQVPAPQSGITTVEFTEDAHDFGAITEGQTVTHRYTYTNTGEHPLLIEGLKPSCGCTAGEYTKEEVAPGKSGYVEVKFNSTGKAGVQKKSVTVTFVNTDPKNKMLTFSGEVVAKAE